MTPSPRYLYRYEAKSIQKYVLASDRLREIKGASAIVEKLSGLFQSALAAQDRGGKCQYAAAGGGTATFDDEDAAKDFYAHWPMIVAQHAPGLQIVQAIVDMGTVANDKLMDAVADALTADRTRPHVDLPEAGPAVARAPRSGLPAVAFEQGSRPIGATIRGETLFDNRAAASLIVTDVAIENEDLDLALLKRLLKDHASGEIEALANWTFVDDIDNLDTRYVAVIHADGNDIGMLIRYLTRVSQAKGLDVIDVRTRFSKKLSQVTGWAVAEALEKALDEAIRRSPNDPRITGHKFPGRPVVVGGDDMTFVIRSDLALPFVKAYLDAFEKHTTGLVGSIVGEEAGTSWPRLTAKAGIAFVHQNFPFHLAFDLAHSLCGDVKRGLRSKDGEITPSGLHFFRVTDSFADDYEELRRAHLLVKKHWLLTMGPYSLKGEEGRPTIDALEALAATISSDRDGANDRAGAGGSAGAPATVPRSAISDVVQHMVAGDVEAARERLARLGEVMTDGPTDSPRHAAWRGFEGALKDLGADVDGWKDNATPLPDALELLPVMKRSTKR